MIFRKSNTLNVGEIAFSGNACYKFMFPFIGNGKMDFTDFVEVMAQDKLVLTTSEQEILAAFQFLDQNCDGYITVDELLQRFHGCISDTEASRLMCEADANGDGKIDFDGR